MRKMTLPLLVVDYYHALLFPCPSVPERLVSCHVALRQSISRKNLGALPNSRETTQCGRTSWLYRPRSRTKRPVCGKVPFLTVTLSHCDTSSAATSGWQSGLNTRVHSISRLQVQRTRADRMDRMFIAHVKALVPFFDCSLFPSQCNEPQEKRPNGHLTAGLVFSTAIATEFIRAADP